MLVDHPDELPITLNRLLQLLDYRNVVTAINMQPPQLLLCLYYFSL